jgi:hypothetical protein
MGWLSRKRQVSLEALQGLSDDVHTLVRRVKQIEDDLAALEGKHEALRGRFYATRGVEKPPQPQTKADILRAHGYLPGRVPPTNTG